MQIKIGDRTIGHGGAVFIIAEACDNHLGSMDTAMEMVLRAKLAGADCIKFQHHLPDEEMLPDTPMSSNFDIPLYDFLKKYAFTLEDHKQLKAYCDEVGITYLCTPFSLAAAREISEIGVDAFKIGSGEMTDIPSLVRIAELGMPLLISTGMSQWEEIDRTYDALISRNVPLCLLNCVSEYPPIYEDVNLGVIGLMQQRYANAVIGHSDHTPDLFTSFAAVSLGACVIEKHVILDKRQPGPDQSVSIDFSELAELVSGIRKIEAAMGDSRKVHDKEKQIREWAFRSLVSTQTISEGTVITQEMVWSKRPGTGIPSHQMDDVIGRTAKRQIGANRLLSWDDLS